MDLYKFGWDRAKEASEDLDLAIEHEPQMVDVVDSHGHTITRPMTPEEEAQFEDDFMQELEADHEGDEE